MLGQQLRKSITDKTWRERSAMDQKISNSQSQSTHEDIQGSTETALVLWKV